MITSTSSDEPRVLSLRQPWAWAVFHRGKDVENRSWRARLAPGTRLLIHAAAGRADAAAARSLGVDLRELPRGELAGMVTVGEITRDSPSRWAQPGAWHWQLTEPVAVLSAFACSGARMLWDAPPCWRSAFLPPGAGMLEPLMSALADSPAGQCFPPSLSLAAGWLAASMPELEQGAGW